MGGAAGRGERGHRQGPAKKLVGHPDFFEPLTLVKFGVPWDEAWSMDREERAAMVIAFGQLEGGTFDWSAMRWREGR